MAVLQTISSEAFSCFGKVLEFPNNETKSFYVVLTEEKSPWRIAVFRYTNKEISTVENHPTSMESFEPLSGVSVLLVAENGTPENYQCFLLDKPVCLYKGVWHQVIAVTPEAQVKITENLEVTSVFHTFEKPLRIIIKD